MNKGIELSTLAEITIQIKKNLPSRAILILLTVIFLVVAAVTSGWDYISTIILPNTTFGLYCRSFWENIMVEVHGSLFDIFVITILVGWFESHKNNKVFITRHREDIADLSHLDTPEINMKKIGIIKRLNSVNIKDISVQNLVLTNVTAKGLMFHKSNLIGFKLSNGSIHSFVYTESNLRSSNFSGSKIVNTEFIKCELYKTDFSGCKASGANFTESTLIRAKLIGADMSSAIFVGVDLRDVSYEDANLRNANFKGAKNLSIKELIKARCLDYIVIEECFRNEILRDRDEVKFSIRKAVN